MKEKTYFGLSVHINNERYVLESDIKNLPFYTFWKESARGTTCLLLDGDNGIYLHDWENFCKLFIETGKIGLKDNN
ncbi:MAG: hypothetical protein PHW89_09240 [Sulfurimonas denitrificans]|nr:hypothetical protein [Sulfurimonas denitrificans]